jgi:hypothetical protein
MRNCGCEEIKLSDDCCRNPNKIVVNDAKFFPNFRLYEQCKNCGGTKRNFPVKYTPDIDIRENLIWNVLKNGKKG